MEKVWVPHTAVEDTRDQAKKDSKSAGADAIKK